MTNPAFEYRYQAPAVSITSERWPADEASSTDRMLAALKVLTTFYRFGEAATVEDIDNVRRWAGDATLSLTDAAVAVVRQELGVRKANAGRQMVAINDCA